MQPRSNHNLKGESQYRCDCDDWLQQLEKETNVWGGNDFVLIEGIFLTCLLTLRRVSLTTEPEIKACRA